MGNYLGLLVLVGLAATIAAALVTLSWVLGPKKTTPYKSAPYECGVTPVGDSRERFPVKFYLVGIIFILFDIEAVFLWSWYTVFAKSETSFAVFSFVSFLSYMASWILGYVYAVRVGAIDWDEATTLAPEKLAGKSEEERQAAVLDRTDTVLGGAAAA